MKVVQIAELSVGELRQIVRDELNDFHNHQQSLTQDRTMQVVVDINGLIEARPTIGTKSTIYKKVSKGIIPHSKQGIRLYFNLNDIDDWLMANRTLTPTEIEQRKSEYLKKRRKR